MTLHLHRLDGCTTKPLAHFLKALGILRLVAGQKDPDARGFFRSEVFHLVTELDRAALLRFFLDEYAPTPVVSPWNGGSGFYDKDSRAALDALRGTVAARFTPIRNAIEASIDLVGDRRERPVGEAKTSLLAMFRATARAGELSWFNAAVALGGVEADRAMYPSLLGTGGNDGRLDFSNNFMQRIVELLVTDPVETRAPRATLLLRQSLFAEVIPGLESAKAIGQFLPGAAGGANGVAGFEADSLINGWDFVLLLEGTILFAVAAVRKLDASGLVQAAAPFAMRSAAVGYASASSTEESIRGEQWMPTWSAPATLAEIRAMLAEGRLKLGRAAVDQPFDAARAISRLGAARGISAFERFGFIERNGRSNLAVPLSGWDVAEHHSVRLLDALAPWLDDLRRTYHDDNVPTSIASEARRVQDTLLSLARSPQLSSAWLRALETLGDVESHLLMRPKLQRPLPWLPLEWLDRAYDGSIEIRLAAAIASQGHWTAGRGLGPLRAHRIPLDPESGYRRPKRQSTERDAPLLMNPRVVCRSRRIKDDLSAIVGRRILEGRQRGFVVFPLAGRINASIGDVATFLSGRVDLARLGRSVAACSALDWRDADAARAIGDRMRTDAADSGPDPAFALFRSLYLPYLPAMRPVSLDPCPFRLLVGGRLRDASAAATARHSAHGMRVRLRHVFGDPSVARRIAAALAIPISMSDCERCLSTITKPEDANDSSLAGSGSSTRRI